MTDTPVPDVREIAARALHAAECSEPNCVAAPEKLHWNLADAVLAAVEPVIRQQVVTQIINDIEHETGTPGWEEVRDQIAEMIRDHLPEGHATAAIARSHSTREEQDHG